MDLTKRISELQSEIEELEATNLHSVLFKQSFSVLSCERVDQIQKIVQDYLKDKITEIDVLNSAATGDRTQASKRLKQFAVQDHQCTNTWKLKQAR
nr:unnamed protein product [Callosobruchus analis]